MEGVLEIERKG